MTRSIIRIKSSKATVATGYVGNEIVALNHRYETQMIN